MRSILFCNEMLGLGHLRRSLALAGALSARDRGSTALVVSGSPAYAGLTVPGGVDILKLPAGPVEVQSLWSRTTARPPMELAIEPRELLALRAELALTAVRSFKPDVAVVDYKPIGRAGELLPALEWLRAHSSCVLAVGLRDIDDRLERLRSLWDDELLETVGRLFDLALVYGDGVPDDFRIERLRAAGIPVHKTALVALPPAERGPDDLGDGYLLVTAGGGVDGFQLLDTALRALAAETLEAQALLVAGPMMPASHLACLRERADGLDVRIEKSRPDMEAVLAGARAVVSMAGYATVAEVLSSGKPALLVPRCSPREEQLNRAMRWAATGRVQMLDPHTLEPRALRRAIETLLEQPPLPPEPFTGASDAADILTLAASRA